jgi:hypothetical protein
MKMCDCDVCNKISCTSRGQVVGKCCFQYKFKKIKHPRLTEKDA